ncbi:endo alpha-1,4 polygalactosaminidase [Eoetvoesiella caeni]|nr:endo alpha-1,4 polygalactosaminidase [Eoetvoesiella caeni]MCI2810882.1 endo alpha-1,4 polygalactosaminidase [Eoetvoesiella caeni]NYT56819.1 endo alpha-1,4 polygalactosaminidase [Eoetvoesiella caeni]
MTYSFGVAPAWAQQPLRNIAFYYGAAPDVKSLQQFQFAVLEPDSGFVPAAARDKKTQWIAYISVGEVASSRSYYSAIPKSWVIGHNAEWHSEVIDQSAPGWPKFFVDNVVAPLWKKGYRGFFLDTLDSYQLVVKSDEQREQARKGLVAVIRAIHRRFPTAVLILNRGFELLPAVHNDIYAVAFESLFKGWSEANGKYIDVPSDARVWLLAQVNNVTTKYKLPVIAIDYCPPEDLQCSRDTVRRIGELNLIPYVGDGRLQTLSPIILE